jgi:undecaprenyl diphosphate synthase
MRNILPVLEAATEAGVGVVTVYVFSTENWLRPAEEVRSMMSIVLRGIEEEVPKGHGLGLRFRFMGDRYGLSHRLLETMQGAEELTKGNDRMDCYFAINYGGQAEIVQAARRIAGDGLRPEDVDAAKFREYLYAPEAPPVDLLIRTSGELRISNFLLWQVAYAELYFTETLWPDFTTDEFSRALASYGSRSRRWGRLPDSVGTERGPGRGLAV